MCRLQHSNSTSDQHKISRYSTHTEGKHICNNVQYFFFNSFVLTFTLKMTTDVWSSWNVAIKNIFSNVLYNVWTFRNSRYNLSLLRYIDSVSYFRVSEVLHLLVLTHELGLVHARKWSRLKLYFNVLYVNIKREGLLTQPVGLIII